MKPVAYKLEKVVSCIVNLKGFVILVKNYKDPIILNDRTLHG